MAAAAVLVLAPVQLKTFALRVAPSDKHTFHSISTKVQGQMPKIGQTFPEKSKRSSEEIRRYVQVCSSRKTTSAENVQLAATIQDSVQSAPSQDLAALKLRLQADFGRGGCTLIFNGTKINSLEELYKLLDEVDEHWQKIILLSASQAIPVRCIELFTTHSATNIKEWSEDETRHFISLMPSRDLKLIINFSGSEMSVGFEKDFHLMFQRYVNDGSDNRPPEVLTDASFPHVRFSGTMIVDEDHQVQNLEHSTRVVSQD